MSQPRAITLLGGPGSGKTTYLGALARALREEHPAARLVLSHLQDDETAIESLIDPLLEATYPQRTKAERHRLRVSLEASDASLNTAFTLDSGDYDGEEIERLFRRSGAFSEEWRARAAADGVLLFLRHDALTPLPRQIDRPPTEDDRWAAVRGDAPSPSADQLATTGKRPEDVFGPGVQLAPLSAPPAQPRDPVKVPTVLALIEVLQFLRHVRGLGPAERPPAGSLRIAILIAAWDAVDTAFRDRGPARYLVEQTPLLHDYLWSNFRDEDVCCFGLSATGGDLRDDAYREKYQEAPQGFVVWSDAATHAPRRTEDISLPIRWALFGERTLGDEP
jgi:hypothetical protein